MRHLFDDPELNVAMWEASAPLITAAREFGPLPAVTTDAFLAAPIVVRQAALIVVGIAAVHRTEQGLLSRADYPGGRYHRSHVLAEYGELQRLRWPPTGDRDLWVRYGPAGPPASNDTKGRCAA